MLSKTNDDGESKYLMTSGGMVTLLNISLQETFHLQHTVSNDFT
jgi:hypothetical protein